MDNRNVPAAELEPWIAVDPRIEIRITHPTLRIPLYSGTANHMPAIDLRSPSVLHHREKQHGDPTGKTVCGIVVAWPRWTDDAEKVSCRNCRRRNA